MEFEDGSAESVQRLKGEKLVYKKPLTEGQVINTSLNIDLKFDNDWSNHQTTWFTLEGDWIVTADETGRVVAVDPMG